MLPQAEPTGDLVTKSLNVGRNGLSTSGDERKALEQRARDAAMPAAPVDKGRWPFPIKDADEGQSGATAENRLGHEDTGNPDRSEK